MTVESPEEQRRRELTFSDPVHKVNTAEFVKSRIERAIEAAGSQAEFHSQWTVNIDADVLRSFNKLQII